MQGGTTFTFVTGGPAAALERARRAADGRNVVVSGGGSTARQYLAASLLDEQRENIFGAAYVLIRPERERFLLEIPGVVLLHELGSHCRHLVPVFRRLRYSRRCQIIAVPIQHERIYQDRESQNTTGSEVCITRINERALKRRLRQRTVRNDV